MVSFVLVKLVARPFVTNRLVEVVLVPVALVQMMLVKLDGVVPDKTRLVKVALVPFKFVTEAFVAKNDVEVEFVVVTLVKTPDDGVTLPIGVLLIEPPVMVAFPVLTFVLETVIAFTVVPEAVAKPSHDVEVPFANVRFEIVAV